MGRWKRGVVGGLLTWLALLTLLGWLDISIHRGVSNNASDRRATEKARSPEEQLAEYTWGLEVFTAILAISTIGLWGVTYLTLRHARADAERQASDMRKSIAAANSSVDAIKMVEMARIVVTRVELAGLNPAGGNIAPKFRVFFQNYGKTPGFVDSTTLRFAPADKRKSLKEIEPFGTRGGTYQNGFLLPPNFQDPGHTDTYGSDGLAANEYDRMSAAGSHEQLFVWGWVQFSPIFGEKWVSHFAYRINFTAKSLQKNVSVGGAEFWQNYKV